MPNLKERRASVYLLTAVSIVGYTYLTYFLEREDTLPLLLTFAGLFGSYILLVNLTRDELDDSHSLLRGPTLLALLFRISLLLAIPNLSDDFYRFIWDGRLLNAGINPFAELPTYYIATSSVPGLTEELFSQLNSPEYFTIYPPLNQLIFWLATLLPVEGLLLPVVVMRLFILAAEVGNIWLLPRVLSAYGYKSNYALFYTLNPLVIVEGVGNLHFEVMMFYFILLGLWWLKKERLVLSAIAIALAVGTKLLPLIFLPFLPRPFSIRRMVIYYATAALATILLFLPLISAELLEGLSSSVSLYYQKFEFNASVYFILRELGFQEFGYNRIEFIGKDLVKYAFWSIILLAYWPIGKRPALPTLLMFALGIYFLLSTTVHPWYIVTVVGLSTFTQYKSPVLWSLLIFLTYAGYSETGYDLPYGVLFLEYGAVMSFFVYELAVKNQWEWPKILRFQ